MIKAKYVFDWKQRPNCIYREKVKGVEALIAELGEVLAERFISLIMREPFDYTQWQRKLFVNKDVAELSAAAMQSRSEVK